MDDLQEAEALEAALDALGDSPTTAQILDVLKGGYRDAGVAAALKRTGGGGGGSQTLAQVLAAGGDPEGNPITGPLQLNQSGVEHAITIDPAELGVGGVTVFKILGASGGSVMEVFSKGSMYFASDDPTIDGMFVQPLNVPDAGIDIAEFKSASGSRTVRVSRNGYLKIKATTVIADDELLAGECAFWFDQTNGAAKLMLKGKTADGTVVTANVPLA